MFFPFPRWFDRTRCAAVAPFGVILLLVFFVGCNPSTVTETGRLTPTKKILPIRTDEPATGSENSGSVRVDPTTAETQEISEEDLRPSLWADPSGEDWPGFLGKSRDGKSVETGICTEWTAEQLKTVWQVEVGEGYGIGSVSDGRFFQLDRHQGQGRIRCFHAETGRLIWTYQFESEYRDMYGYDSGPRCSPVVDGERVYIYGVEGKLICLNAITGRLIWNVDTVEKFGVVQNFFGVASTPVVHENTLVVMVGGSPPESRALPAGQLDRVKPNGSAIVGFDKLTGEVRYAAVDDLASYTSLITARIHDRQMVIAWCREQLYGLDPDTGKVHFSFPWRSRKLESVNASTPVVHQDQIFISECYGLGSVLLDIKKSERGFEPVVVWSDGRRRDKALETHWNTPVFHDGKLYACSGRQTAQADLRCVDLATGQVQWSQGGTTRCSLTYVDGYLASMAENGELFLIRATPEKFDFVTRYDAGLQGQIRFRSPCWAAPVISHGYMFVRGRDNLVCFRLVK